MKKINVLFTTKKKFVLLSTVFLIILVIIQIVVRKNNPFLPITEETEVAEGVQFPRQMILPFQVEIEPMKRLLVANFKNDPEFIGMEPQVFDDPINGKGMRLLRYRKNGKVDIYWQPGLNPPKYTAGEGLADLMETPFKAANFEITDRGVQLNVAFTDAQGRLVEFKVHENSPGKHSFPFLAPIGRDDKHPQRFFLVYMLGFDFVRRSGTEVAARIGERRLYPETLPLLRQFRKIFLIRYAAMPVIGALNPPMRQPLIIQAAEPGSVEVSGMKVLVNQSGKVDRINVGEGLRSVELDFAPAFPSLNDLSVGKKYQGTWEAQISKTKITGGFYQLRRAGERVSVELVPTKRWKPAGIPFSVFLLTRIDRSFLDWPISYRWRGVVELGSAPTMTGSWERVGK